MLSVTCPKRLRPGNVRDLPAPSSRLPMLARTLAFLPASGVSRSSSIQSWKLLVATRLCALLRGEASRLLLPDFAVLHCNPPMFDMVVQSLALQSMYLLFEGEGKYAFLPYMHS